ncbi:MAG: hypothetical protein WHU95_08430 [candidate division WOR-3 bacterium]|jgi:hypothetical protein|nr:hypothetical protein [candidate division WOR-3 bacterium]MDH7519543.1 hypothetical protein [bacterium]
MKDLFGNELTSDTSLEINIYADEIKSKECPYTKDKWFYIGIIVEDLSNPLLEDIILERFRNNLDRKSPYYSKNNHIIHWSKLDCIDTKNICKRWFGYILDPTKSAKKFYCYILGINDTKLNKTEFDPNDPFNSRYNRFFRSALMYGIKTFFPSRRIVVKNIYHEKGQQQYDEYFPWHCIYKISQENENISFECTEVKFLPKDHREEARSNIIQLCDAFMGACVSIIHGISNSNRSIYRRELLDMIFPLVEKMIHEPYNKKSPYLHANRIMLRFFPKEKTVPCDITRLKNQFYICRPLYYEQMRSKQLSLF